MQIKLYNFTKKKKSTAVPTGGTTLNVNLKEDTTLLNPSFNITSQSMLPYNYIEAFGRFYFVSNNTKRNNNIVDLDCAIDPLASWRASILASSQFVCRSASDNNPYLIDAYVNASEDIVQTLTAETTIATWSNSGVYIVKVASPLGGNIYYAATKAQLIAALDFMFTESNFPDMASDGLIKYFFDPIQYIGSVEWFPIAASSVPSSGSSGIVLGYWVTGATSLTLSDQVYDPTFSITIPATRYYNDWRDYDSNFTKVVLYLPCYGVYDLPPEYIGETIGAKYVIDFRSGECTILLKVNNAIIADLTFHMGVSIQLSQTQDNIKGAISGATQAFSGAMSANPVAIAEGVNTMITAKFQPVVTQKGSVANMSMALSEPNLKASVIRHGTSGNPNTRLGKPLMEHRALSSLSGFCQCQNAAIDIAGTDTEKEMIESLMNEGFYIE